MTSIEINHLTKVIHKNTVLENITVNMNAGTIYGFQGINGSGKTMLMRHIIGLIRPTKGSIAINRKVLGKDIEFPDSVGFLLENPTFLDGYSGFDNLKMLASIRGKINDQKIKNSISSVGLDPADKKKYRKYSLGMKQRLGIAGAVMEQPDIIILDEPTNSLDTSGVELVKKILLEQKQRGALVILSCHDLSILQEMSDEIIKLEYGHMVDHLRLDNIS